VQIGKLHGFLEFLEGKFNPASLLAPPDTPGFVFEL